RPLLLSTLFPYTTLFRSPSICSRRARLKLKLPFVRSEATSTKGPLSTFFETGDSAVVGHGARNRRIASHMIRSADTRVMRQLGRSEEHTSELQSLRHLVC